MSTLVRYTPEDRVLDLAKLSPSDYELIRSLRSSGAQRGKLVCLQSAADDAAADMYIKLIKGNYWAVHFPGGAHNEPHAISVESDEHKRQKDYWHRAAVDAGYQASKEYPSPSD